MRIKLVAISLFLTTWSLQAQEIARGVIYEDINRNGKLDRNEKRLPNVLVSNGVEVVPTNAKGEYQIEVNDETILFVIKPAHYQFTVLKDQLPQSYYIHKPKGSPALKYEGSLATGKLPKSINFGLTPTQEGKEFSALVFGDPQTYTLEEVEFFSRGIIDELKGIKNMQFGISLGDLVGDDLVLHQPYIKAVKEVGIPWYNVIGNHDMDFDATEDKYSDETYENNFGPTNYSFNVGHAHFIVLDDILYPDPRDGKGYWGGLREDQLAFVKNNLKYVPKDKLIVLAFHIPLKHNDNAFRSEDRERLFELLKDYPHTVSLSAHTHLQQQLYYGKEEGWLQAEPHHEFNVGTTSGDWYSGKKDEKGVPISTMRDGTPKGYVIMHVKDNQYRFDYKVANKPASYQMNIYNTKMVKQGSRNRAMLMVNFFMGQKGDAVEYQIENGEWKKLNFTPRIDYNYLKSVMDYDENAAVFDGRRPSDAVESTHIWSARLPHNLTVGKYKINIRATDKYGHIHTGQTEFEVIK